MAITTATHHGSDPMTAIVYREQPFDTASGPDGVAMSADERLGQPLRNQRIVKRKRRARLGLVLILLGTATWFDPSLWSRAYSISAPLASATYDYAWKLYADASASPPPATTPDTTATAAVPPSKPDETIRAEAPPPPSQPDRVEPAPPRAVATVPVTPQGTPYETSKPAAASASDVYTDASPKPTDPLRKRAASAGLHPDLPRAVLEKLTDADLKSASTAIRKALSSADDAAVVIWPEKPRTAAAQFRVNFVEGAAPACRRYVVAIARDGWKTTALPVEKCGTRRAAVSRS